MKFQFIDADDNGDLCRKFEIKAVPTFILIEDGQEVRRMNGAKTQEQIEEFIKDE
jgi:thioredoxin-like negative regulator of GroEL